MLASTVASTLGVGKGGELVEVGSAAATAAATVAPISTVGAGVGVRTGACATQASPMKPKATNTITKMVWFMSCPEYPWHRIIHLAALGDRAG